MNSESELQRVVALERTAIEHMRLGQEARALTIWARLIDTMPGHAVARTQLGQAAFKQRDFATAKTHFEAAAEADAGRPRAWINLALALQQLGSAAAEEAALHRALVADPYDLLALVLRGSFFERHGKHQLAATAFSAALAVAPPDEQLAPELQPAIGHAHAYHQRHQQQLAAFLDERLAPHLQACSPASRARFGLSVDILLGRKRRYEAHPIRYFFPHLPAVEFLDRDSFPWLGAMEQKTEAIRDEFLAVLDDGPGGFSPYIGYGADQPVAQWAALNHNPDWSAFHLVKDGKVVAANATRCPATMGAWAATPSPDQPGRTPVMLFSALKPRTRIPPHVGASNCRLVVHLPLIVPPQCGFRVGATTRQWEPGKAWVFDDTIEHEAWNDSDALRVVLIFDTWHPMISADERSAITAMNQALNEFAQGELTGYDV